MNKRRVVRKVSAPPGDYFESHVWPVNLAIVVTGGFISGIAIASLWGGALSVLIVPCLVLIALLTFVAALVATLLDRRWVRRTLQFALAVAIFIHLALLFGMSKAALFDKGLPQGKTLRKDEVAQKPTRRTDFSMRRTRSEQPRPIWSEPVPTPAPEERPAEVERPEPVPLEEVAEALPQPSRSLPEPVASTDPRPPEAPSRQTPGEAVPRFSATPSLLSRQMRDANGPPSTSIAEAPDAGQSRPNVDNGLAAQGTTIAQKRSDAPPAVANQPTVETPGAPAERAVARSEPQPSEAPTPSAGPSLARRSSTAGENLPRIDLAAEVVPTPADAGEQTPQETMIADASRTRTAAPATERSDVQPDETERSPEASLARQSVDLDERPQVAQVERTSPSRQERSTPRAVTTSVADIATPSASSAQLDSQPAMRVADASTERTSDAAAALSRSGNADVPAPSAPTERTVARSDSAQSAPDPTPASSGASPARATIAAARPSTTVVAETPGATAAESGTDSLAPGATSIARSDTAAAIGSNAPGTNGSPEAGAGSARSPATALARAETAGTMTENPTSAETTPGPGRAALASAAPGPGPTAIAGAASADAGGEPSSAAAGPGQMATTRAETGSAFARAVGEATVPSSSPQRGEFVQRRPEGARTPGVSQAPFAMARSGAIADSLPGIASTDVPGETSEGPSIDGVLALAPGGSSVTKGTGESSLASTVSGTLATDQQGQADQPGSDVARATPGEGVPSLASVANDPTSPTRTAAFAASPISPLNAERAALADSARPTDAPGLDAAPIALSRGYGGVAGTGESPNVGMAGPADPGQAAASPSGSIARAESTQTGPDGPAVTPSEAAPIAQARADRQIAGGPIVSTDVPTPGGAGIGAPAGSETFASSSAALSTALADASQGAVTAASGGSIEFDMGPSRIVAEGGSSRGGGGGQPEINVRSQGTGPARREAGGVPNPSIASAVVGPEAGAPRGSGGGAGTAGPEERSTAIARSTSGGAGAFSGGETAAGEPGIGELAGAAQRPGERSIGRALPREAIPSDSLGSGGEPGGAGALARDSRRADLAGGPTAPGSIAVADVPSPGTSGGGGSGNGAAGEGMTGPATAGIARTSLGGTGIAAADASLDAAAEPGGVGSGREGLGGGPTRAAATGGGSAGAPAIGAITAAGSTLERSGPSAAAGTLGPTTLGQVVPGAAAIAPVDVSPGGAPSSDGPTIATLVRGEGGPAKTETGQGGGAIAASNVAAPGVPTGVTGGERIGAPAIGRAEASAGAPGPAAAGGGAFAARTSRDASIPAFARSSTIELAGSPGGGGNGEMTLPQAGEAGGTRLSGGAGSTAFAPAGGTPDAGDLSSPRVAVAGTQAARPRTGGGDGDAPGLAEVGQTSTLARTSTGPRSPGIATVAAAPIPAVDSGSGTTGGSMEGPSDMGGMSRQASGGALALVPAPEGMGGVGMRPAPAAGIDSPRATVSDVPILVATDSRFPGRQLRGNLNLDVTATYSAPSFSGRSRPDMRPPGNGPGDAGSPLTEKSVDEGVSFLARHQMPDGSWSLDRYGAGRIGYEGESASMVSDTAATGLALIAIQGAGYTHREHRYRENVQRGIAWLVAHQQENGDLYVPQNADSGAAWLYSHGIAALALTEAYGMTQDPALREPAQKALDFIVASQEKQLGGWRYTPGYGADTSVTGWMAMALKSGDLAGLDVPESTYDGVKKWLDYSQVRGQPHLYRYNAFAADTAEQRHGRSPTASMTSVGLLMRMYYGWRRDDPQLVAGADYLLQNLPEHATAQLYREGKNPRDTYYWYYATQVMYHMGGDRWQQWHDRLHPMLLETQIQSGEFAGSWDPLSPIPDRWGPHGGRIYVTAMNLLSLEVEYRHLPLYEETAK